MLTQVSDYNRKSWHIFTIRDQDLYDTLLDINLLGSSDTVRDLTLSYATYNVVDGVGYGFGSFTRGMTEQEAYEGWLTRWNLVERAVIQSLKNWKVFRISQNRFDALVFLQWFMGDIRTITGAEGTYDLKSAIVQEQWDTAADMIMLNETARVRSQRCANIFRLADYGDYKTRKLLRTQGIHNMRNKAGVPSMDSLQLKRIRFAYFAETGDFLPFTPEGIKRDIVKKYKDTLIQQQFIYQGTNTFELLKSPSMYPVEKLKVLVNGQFIQHYFDYTLQDRVLTITKSLLTNDIIETTIKI
jgi:hypothetical protein